MLPRLLRPALLPVGIVFGLAVEWAFYDPSLGPALSAADLVTGCTLIACGAVAWDRRQESRIGALMSLAGATWFLGNLASALLYLHRGPLVHLYLSYPTGRVSSRLTRAVVAIAYVDAVVEPLASNTTVTLVLSGLVALTALRAFAGTSGSARKAAGPALAAALAFSAVLALGALSSVTGWPPEHALLWIYDLVIASTAVVLLVDLLRSRWAEAVVTGLVVELGSPVRAATLRTTLARALGDPSLVVGYRLEGTGDFVDDGGRPVELPSPGSGRTVTPLVDRGEQVAVLVHDEALLADRRLIESVAAAARLAVANAALQAEARAQAARIEASRRRIVEAADMQRRRIQKELHLGAARRLETVAELLARAQPFVAANDAEAIAGVQAELVETRHELDELAHSVLPATLTDEGLLPALTALARRSAIPVEVNGSLGRLPEPVEAALFYVCSEALANVIKHAAASSATIDVRTEPDFVVLDVADDGVGGAEPGRGSGLVGLADRVGALGGTLRITSPPGAGTRIIAELPVIG